MALRDVVRKVYNKLLVNNEGYLKYLRSRGVTIGEDVTFHCPGDTHVDITDPHLLTIGDHVNLTGPITILTHDYGWSVVKGKTGEILGMRSQSPLATTFSSGGAPQSFAARPSRTM